jgi:hypothetical protein
LAYCAGSFTAAAQSDNFNDSDDNGWTHYDPLDVLGGPQTSFLCTNGTYRIKGTSTPDLATYGPGRGGAFITTTSYTEFYVSVDVVSWDTNLHQLFGVCARVSDLGLLTTKGYLFNLDTGNPALGDMDIARIDQESGTPIETGGGAVALTPGASYRLVFMGNGPDLDAFLFQLPNTVIPIGHVSASDPTYDSGHCGLLVADEVNGSAQELAAPDVTFDNYFASDRMPPPPMMIASDPVAQTIAVSWAPYPGYVLESAPSLSGTVVWTEETPTSTSSTKSTFEAASDTGSRYFRLKKTL